MITKTDTLTWNISSSIGQHPSLKESVIFDIETTGLSPKNSFVYLIGVLFQNDKKWQLTQWLAESQKDEAALFTAFFCFLKNFRFLIHFNGDAFDLPFLKKKMRGIPSACFPGISDKHRPLPKTTPPEKISEAFLHESEITGRFFESVQTGHYERRRTDFCLSSV